MRDEVPGSVVPRMQTAAIGRAWQERLATWTIGLVQLGKSFRQPNTTDTNVHASTSLWHVNVTQPARRCVVG